MSEQLAKPRAVRVAVALLWFSVLVGTATVFYQTRPHLPHPIVLLIVMLFCWLVAKTSAGRNWARITCLILLAAGAYQTTRWIASGAGIPAVTVLQVVLQYSALILLFTPAAHRWFRYRRSDGGQAAPVPSAQAGSDADVAQ